MKKSSITVICLVYNEEKRIERFIRSFYHYDEIILIDKSSTDRTAELAKNWGIKVITVPYTDSGNIWNIGIEAANSEWIFLLTSSDVAHPLFSQKLFDLIDDPVFNNSYDIIEYPCVMHILGINSPYSAFDYSHRNGLSKKDIISISDMVHQEISFKSDRLYHFPFDRNIAIHHLSHETIDMYYDRQLRYSKEELKKDKTYKMCMYDIFKEIYRGIKKRFWKLGWKGIGLVLMMVNYRILILLRYMENDCGNVKEIYNKYASELSMLDNGDFRNQDYKEIHTNNTCRRMS